jgi:ssDNA-binding replication factor A large subunit
MIVRVEGFPEVGGAGGCEERKADRGERLGGYVVADIAWI